ncbi:Crp/Fnr family transcriptional regulator [Frigidibacter albus]|uniref:Cyclic nucleotide-binding protein n=2 Tax=Frigidibacter mobilis TaxID=1335048 RepID=A0A165SNM4_9RHOB|nr:cyclic nucleotide-binding protein [Frigidibacter mobilis]
MERFKIGELTIEAGRTILMQGAQSPQFYTVLRGQGLRHKTLENGRRQVISFVLPGDLVGLQAVVTGEMQHSVEASVETTLCVFDRAGLWDLFSNQPKRSYSLTWLSAVEENFLGETLATLGQRDASQRIAWALVRLHERLSALGMARSGRVPLPWRQQDLADAVGLSLVHTNKTLARLRESGLADWSGGGLSLPGRRELAEMAGIDLEYPTQRPLL